MYKFGFIGTGKMGSAVLRSVVKTVNGSEILLANRTADKAKKLCDELGCALSSNEEIAEKAEYIVIGVKPQMFNGVMEKLRDILKARKDRFILVSMMGGKRIEDIKAACGISDCPVIRIMPNIPMAIGMGMTSYAFSPEVSEKETEFFLSALKASGKLIALPEHLIDAGSGVAGCSPAYTAMFIEALADGGVACGLTRAQALEMSAQAVMGSAAYILSACKNPEELKDAVCSPGGSTIQGVRALEEGGMRGAVIDAVIDSYEASAKLR